MTNAVCIQYCSKLVEVQSTTLLVKLGSVVGCYLALNVLKGEI